MSDVKKESSAKKPGKNVKKKEPNKFNGFMKKIAKFFKDCLGEIKRIVWPTPRSTFKSSGVVLVVVAIMCVFVFLLDLGFMRLLGLVMNVTG